MFVFILILPLVSAFSVSLEPFYLTPHVRLCNIHKKCYYLLLVLDTGSPDLWLSDSSCVNCPERSVRCLPTHNLGNTDSNHTKSLSPKEIQYGIGWVKGFELDYQICGIVTKIICVTHARDVTHYSSHGVIGIGGNSTGKEFMLKLLKSMDANSSLSLFFGSYFTELTIGGLNYEYVKEGSQLNYYKASPEWALKVDSLSIDNQTITKDIPAMIDTGSSMLVLPQFIFDHIHQQIRLRISDKCINKVHGIECPCASPASINLFPEIQIAMKSVDNQSRTYVIKPHSYVSMHKHKCTADIVCLKIYALERMIILGNPFMRYYITVFDFYKQHIGIIESDRDRIKSSYIANMTLISCIIVVIVGLACKLALYLVHRLQQKDGKLTI